MQLSKGIVGAFVAATLPLCTLAAPTAKYLTAKDAAIAQAQKWQATGVAKPLLSDDGMVLFPFGQYMPTFTCAPLRACDIELEAGEEVVSKPKIGDSRWIVSSMKSGPRDAETIHVVVKPTDVNLDTNIIIPTDRRVYHILLKSSDKDGGDYIHRGGFYYPEDIVTKWGRDEKKHHAKEVARAKLGDELARVSLDKLSTDYVIEGTAAFRPVRVFNDTEKTWIQLPTSVKQAEFPILVAQDDAGTPLKVNYRPVPYGCNEATGQCAGDYLLVDYVVKRAMLVLGKDDDLQKVEIRAAGVEPATSRRWSIF